MHAAAIETIDDLVEQIDQHVEQLIALRKAAKGLAHSPRATGRNVLSLLQFCRDHPDLSGGMSAMRWLIHNRKNNGLRESGAVSKTGGRYFVDVDLFRDYRMAASAAEAER